MDRWINVERGLPGHSNDLWLCSPWGEYTVGHLDSRGQWVTQADDFQVQWWREIEEPSELL